MERVADNRTSTATNDFFWTDRFKPKSAAHGAMYDLNISQKETDTNPRIVWKKKINDRREINAHSKK